MKVGDVVSNRAGNTRLVAAGTAAALDIMLVAEGANHAMDPNLDWAAAGLHAVAGITAVACAPMCSNEKATHLVGVMELLKSAGYAVQALSRNVLVSAGLNSVTLNVVASLAVGAGALLQVATVNCGESED